MAVRNSIDSHILCHDPNDSAKLYHLNNTNEASYNTSYIITLANYVGMFPKDFGLYQRKFVPMPYNSIKLERVKKKKNEQRKSYEAIIN